MTLSYQKCSPSVPSTGTDDDCFDVNGDDKSVEVTMQACIDGTANCNDGFFFTVLF